MEQDLAGRIAAYRAAGEEFLAVAEPVRDHQLDRQPPEPEGWTPRQVIHHLADAEANAYVRLRRLLAEPPGPIIQAFDEAAWARELRYDRPVAASLDLIRAVRQSCAELLDTLSPEDLERHGFHTETGRYTPSDWLDWAITHARDHAEQIRWTLG